jgi:prepilin-type N-terminal cleavage/methylation domain-containing protein
MNVIRYFKSQKGFTMVELVIVIVLIGIIAMTASLLIGQAAQSYQKEDNYSAVLNQGRLALERMAREIRTIRSSRAVDISSCTATTLGFIDANGIPVTYNYAGTTLTETNGLGTNILADKLNVFGFVYSTSVGGVPPTCSAIWSITINLTPAQGSESLPLRISIHPRSF